MAQLKKPKKKLILQPVKRIKPWAVNKIAEARKLGEHPGARAAHRWGAPAGVALVVFLLINPLFLPQSRLQQIKNNLQKNPDDFQAQIALAEIFLDNHQFEEAERILLLAQNQKIPSDQQILGEQTGAEIEELWQRKISTDPQEIKKLINTWKKVLEEKPNYRDAYLQLAYFYYQLDEKEKAKESLENAFELDPNNEITRELKNLFQ